jgi:hypothetical protein
MKTSRSYLPTAFFLLAASCNVTAQTLCADLDEVIDESILAIALSEAEGQMFDKSAQQQTSRYLGFNNQLQVININLAIQSQNKCPPRKNGINPFRHKWQALECFFGSPKEG